MSTAAVYYLHPRYAGALTKPQADALDYIDRRIGRVLRGVTLRLPIGFIPNDDLPPGAAPAAPPPQLAA